MPAEFNHIDDFFRAKEEESSVPRSMQEGHWQQMEKLLAATPRPAAKAKIRTLRASLLWQAAAVILLAAGAFLLLHRQKANADPSSTAVKRTGGAPSHGTAGPDRHAPTETTVHAQDATTSASTSIAISDSHTHHAIQKSKASAKDLIAARNATNSYNNKKIYNSSNKQPSYPTETTVATNPTPAPDARAAYRQLYASLRRPDQQFQIDADRDTTVHCAQGTTIFIPAKSFVTRLGTPAKHLVTISVREAYTFADIIADGLTTLSGENQIRTAGMIRILASIGAEPLDLRPGGNLRLQMPTDRIDPRMQLFTGQPAAPDSTRSIDETVDWLPAGQKQTFLNESYKMVSVMNLNNNSGIRYRHPYNPSRSTSVATYRIAWDCAYSTAYVKQKLEQRYGRFYDEIVVKRHRRPLFRMQRARASEVNWEDGTYIVGNTLKMLLAEAMKKRYLTVADSLAYEAKWKADMDKSIKEGNYNDAVFRLTGDYFFNITKLGWINCDAFMGRQPDQLTDLLVYTDKKLDQGCSSTILIFKRRNAVLPGHWDMDGNLQFRSIGRGEAVTIISIGTRDGKPYAGMRELVTGAPQKVEVEVNEITPEELRARLSQLGAVNRS